MREALIYFAQCGIRRGDVASLCREGAVFIAGGIGANC